jgi:2-oxo-4-hydroxy-4-carboxy--5-ureidoimidazoline (OHCU) decarboxylase
MKMPEFEKPVIINGIRDDKCRCTATTVCRFCAVSKRYSGKFSKPWAEAVKEHNEKTIKEDEPR